MPRPTDDSPTGRGRNGRRVLSTEAFWASTFVVLSAALTPLIILGVIPDFPFSFIVYVTLPVVILSLGRQLWWRRKGVNLIRGWRHFWVTLPADTR